MGSCIFFFVRQVKSWQNPSSGMVGVDQRQWWLHQDLGSQESSVSVGLVIGASSCYNWWIDNKGLGKQVCRCEEAWDCRLKSSEVGDFAIWWIGLYGVLWTIGFWPGQVYRRPWLAKLQSSGGGAFLLTVWVGLVCLVCWNGKYSFRLGWWVEVAAWVSFGRFDIWVFCCWNLDMATVLRIGFLSHTKSWCWIMIVLVPKLMQQKFLRDWESTRSKNAKQ